MPDSFAKTWLLLALFSAPALAQGDHTGSAGSVPVSADRAPLGTSDTLFVAPGASNSLTTATLVHCTNLSDSKTAVIVEFLNYDATLVCTLALSQLDPLATGTLATKFVTSATAVEVCRSPGVIDQGLVRVMVPEGLPTDVVCSVHVVDPVATTPVFATALQTYPR